MFRAQNFWEAKISNQVLRQETMFCVYLDITKSLQQLMFTLSAARMRATGTLKIAASDILASLTFNEVCFVPQT